MDAIPKSISAVTIDATGSISRGKYTFVIKFRLLTKLWVDLFIAPEKNIHGSKAEYENRGYGIPSLGIRAKNEKTIVKIIISNKGWNTAQATPRTDCLYLTLISRITRLTSSSR